MRITRLLRHVLATHWHTRMVFPGASLDAIEGAIAQAERSHRGQIRFAIETALTPLQVLGGLSAHERALEVFSRLRVWDTEHNNGVLIYVQLADRHVEIIADRGFRDRVSAAQWQAVCALMEQRFRAREYHRGALDGVEAVGALLAAHYPAPAAGEPDAGNELPDRPTLL